MPNIIDASGMTIQTNVEIVSEIVDGTPDFPGLNQIYGPGANLDPNSPDGQMVNIFAQAKLDFLEFVQSVYAGMDPDRAFGRTLDARCAINGVTRRAGTQTLQNVAVVVDRALTLQGLDLYPASPFTVADSSGNKYALVNTVSPSGAGTTTAAFQALLLGPVSSLPNTITTIVTIQLGVISVNNPTTYTALGVSEQTDPSLRLLRQRSVSLPNKGYLEGLFAGLLNTADVTDARVYENNTSTTDGDGIPGHSIWAIVLGGTNADVAKTIYVKRNAGAGMKGSISVVVTQVDGSLFTIKFDRPTPQNLWISFTVAAIGTGTVDPTFIRAQLLQQLTYSINQPADTTSIVALIRAIQPNASVSSEGVSDDGTTYTSLLTNSTIDRQWALAPARIIINGLAG